VINIEHNFGDRATQFARYAGAWTRAVAAGLRDIAITVERAAVKNTGGPGSAAPGSYPVPVRTGGAGLRGSIQSRFGARDSMVIATAVYARAIHEGFQPYGNPKARRIGGRPYLQNAIDSIDANEIMAIRINKELPA
jgi:hypothetical protein